MINKILMGVIAWAFAMAPLAAQETVADGLSETSYEITLRDGVKLKAYVTRPADAGPLPVVLYATPYARQSWATLAPGFAAAGYAFLAIDVRGAGESEGTFAPFIDEIPDLLAITEWTLKQKWSDDRIAVFGISSSSYSAQLLAATGHPAVKALINVSGLNDTQQLFYPGGAFRLDTLMPWLQFFYLQQPVRGMDAWNAKFNARPLAGALDVPQETIQRMAASRVPTQSINVPTLNITGWNDVVYRHTLALHEGLTNGPKRPQTQLVIGPWEHNQVGVDHAKSGDLDFGESAIMTGDAFIALMTGWLDQQFKGAVSDASPVRAFIMGDDWREFQQWPPARAEKRKFYLDARSRSLSATAPRRKSTRVLDVDPENPVPTFGGVNSHLFPMRAGPRDQAEILARDDVLVFQTPLLDAPLVLAGPMNATIYFKSDAASADIVAKLVEIREDGFARIIEDGIKRVALDASGAAIAEIALGQSGLSIPAGSRLAVALQGSNFPKYTRNPHTGDDAWNATEFLSARHSILTGPLLTSRIELTVLP